MSLSKGAPCGANASSKRRRCVATSSAPAATVRPCAAKHNRIQTPAELPAWPCRNPSMIAAALRDSRLVHDLAREFVTEAAQMCDGEVPHKPYEMTYGTMCSGTEGSHEVFNALSDALTATDCHVHNFVQKFGCELVEFKQRWGMRVVPDSRCCMFCDATHMGGAKARCARHDQHCDIPHVDALVVGFSCKDVCTFSPQDGAGILAQSSSPGGTSQTYHAIMVYVDRHAPHVVVLENSDHLSDNEAEAGSNLDILRRDFGVRRYRVTVVVMDSQVFALPQARRRTYILCTLYVSQIIELGDSTEYYDIMRHNLLCLLECFQRTPPPLQSILFDAGDHRLDAELAARQQRAPRDTVPGTTNIHMTVFKTQGMRWGSCDVGTVIKESPWYQASPKRQKQALAYATTTSPEVAGFDAGQSLYRLQQTTEGANGTVAPSVTTNTELFMVADDLARYLATGEYFRLQGFSLDKYPLEDASEFSLSQRMDLVGNAMSLTVMLAMLTGMCFAVPWKRADDVTTTSTDEVEDALQAMAASSSRR